MAHFPYKRVFVTGGCGFVGSTLALKIKALDAAIEVIVLDNFIRKGSRLNTERLQKEGITVIEGDIRDREKLLEIKGIDLIIDCAAEPSVLAGSTGSPLYVTDVNLVGTLNCLELARVENADFVFLSTSRVYPVKQLSELSYSVTEKKFELEDKQSIAGVNAQGIAESFPISSPDSRTLYGSTKLCCEYLIQEFINSYKLKAVINRCGVIAGPWQFGKVDQGIAALWMSHHIYQKNLSYIGFGGEGKQVRDMMHVDDLWDALLLQLNDMEKYSGGIYNLGGGRENAVSLMEMTEICQKVSGNTVYISSDPNTRTGDIPIFITDHSKFTEISGWRPKRSVEKIFTDIHGWIIGMKEELSQIL